MGCNVSSRKISGAIENKYLKSEQPSGGANLHESKHEQNGRNQEFATGEEGAHGQQEQQRICGTNLTFEWLHQKLMEIYKCNEAEPPWIVEMMNHGPYQVRRPLKVVKVTLGWENPHLPTTVVLKICGMTGEHNSILYKTQNWLVGSAFRKCIAYEWFDEHRIPSVPKTMCIKARSTKRSFGVIMMEDLSATGQEGSIESGLHVHVIMKLLRILAFIHAKSLESREWIKTMPEVMTLQHEELSKNYERAKKVFLNHLDDVQLQTLRRYFTADYMIEAIKLSKEDKQTTDEALLHGRLLATNILFPENFEKIFIVDWSKDEARFADAHAGSIGEDLTQLICWNLSPADRRQNLSNFLEHYSYHFSKHFPGAVNQSAGDLRRLYIHFLPLAMSRWILMFADMDPDKEAMKAIVERAQALVFEVLSLCRQQKCRK